MGILLGLLSGLLWPAIIVGLIIWFASRSSKSKSENSSRVDSGFYPSSMNESQIRTKIAGEIRAQLGMYKSSAQKKVVEDMAQTVEYFATHTYGEAVQSSSETAKPEFVPSDTTVQYEMTAVPQISARPSSQTTYETPWRKLQLLDGATILLYLGAFFLLAAIGLYVGLGQGGSIKSLLVSLITVVFYCGGVYLYKNSSRLKPAGLTFSAIGMATLPMAGTAFYYFALDKQNGPAVWLITSLLAIALYAHATYVLRSNFVSYMVVFSSLSVVLSTISALGIAPYYYIQGMSIAGVIFALLARVVGGSDVGVDKAYDRSSMFLVPFSASLAVLFVGQTGWFQLALSLLIATIYYTYMATDDLVHRGIYTLLAQIGFIGMLFAGVYGAVHEAEAVAVMSGLVSLAYLLSWFAWGSQRKVGDLYRSQIKYITLFLPYVALGALAGHGGLLYLAVSLIAFTSISVYILERDALSGIGWWASLLALPALLGFLTLDADTSTVGIWYCALTSLALLVRSLIRSKATQLDLLLGQSFFIVGLSVSGLLQVGQANILQLTIASIGMVLLFFWSILEQRRFMWLSFLPLYQLAWVGAFFDNRQYLLGWLALVVATNFVLAQFKKSYAIHDWFGVVSLFIIPPVIGTNTTWDSMNYWTAYALLCAALLTTRYYKKLFSPLASSTGYFAALCLSYVLAYQVNGWFGVCYSVVTLGVLLVMERIDSSPLSGYIAPFVLIGLLFVADRTVWQTCTVLLLSAALSTAIGYVRKRQYELFVSVLFTLLTLWYIGTSVYSWSDTVLMAVYFAVSASYMAKRFALKSRKQSFSSALVLGYTTALTIAFIYACATSWQTMSIGLFVVGLYLTVISYLENSPAVIIGSFIAGYTTILRFSDGNKLSITATAGILLVVSQATYWALVASKLDTVRAQYARTFQIIVASLIPVVGLAYFDRPIFPASLTLFSAILCKEVWGKGQNARECALFMVHLSGLWWLFALAVREIQVYTQLTALLLAGFAYWRRRLLASPSLINQYLWIAVLFFSIPMAVQAIGSSNPAYAYLLLVEHVLLIVLSIALKRATFAWWGIAVTVAAVLYQLRKLRYAALAFLGVFIISLAVYFLLRYNKPDQQK